MEKVIETTYILIIILVSFSGGCWLGGKENKKTDYKIELLNQTKVEITTKDGEKHIISADSIQQFINKTPL